MIQVTLDNTYILRKAIFTLTISSSSNPDNLYDTNIFGYSMGLDVEAVAVDNMQCVLIDTDYFNRLDLVPYLDSNGNQEVIELYDSNGKLKARYQGYVLFVHFFEDGIIEIRKVICLSYDNLFQTYNTNILFGKGTPIISL